MSPAEILQQEIVAKGQEIFTAMKDETVSIFRKDFWNGKIMEWCMSNEAFKVEMFRFVDVLPSLHSSSEVARHIREYFCREGLAFPTGIQSTLGFIGSNMITANIAARSIRKNVTDMARMFIAGEKVDEAIGPLQKLRKDGIAFTVDILGEAALSEQEALGYQAQYLHLLDQLHARTQPWAHHPILEHGHRGEIPRINVSVKLSSLYSQVDPIDFEGSRKILGQRLGEIVRKAKAIGAFINIDMEQYSLKDLTLATLKSVLEEEDLKTYPHVGVAMQAYLRDCLEDLANLASWCEGLKRRLTIRLVKGAYWDYETVLAKQNDWPIPVFTEKHDTDANFERCTDFILKNHHVLDLAIGSHNLRSIANAVVQAKKRGLPREAIEIQMLFGMAEPIKKTLSQQGYRLRDYAPVGELIPGMAYLVRRLLENTSNESWLRLKFFQGADVQTLLRDPKTLVGVDKKERPRNVQEADFRNEPSADFHVAAQRDRMRAALAQVRRNCGQEILPMIGKHHPKTAETYESLNPARPQEVIGRVHLADVEWADKAVEIAVKAQPLWESFGPRKRAAVLFQAAKLMRERKFELSAWMVVEEGKPWREAYHDINEAIDFLEYYGREMQRLGEPQRLVNHIPAELNHLFYQPRGVGLVIAPWNFPLAIPTGMVSAALVAGNAVLFKPAEPASVIGLKLVEILRQAGVPEGVITYLPCKGSTVGSHLVSHPQVDFIAFTGSREVGLKIVAAAGVTRPGQKGVKRVIAEMGGKNAIIVDSDADLDEAVKGVIYSAFGYAGQKCSACSRVIVLNENYDLFVNRLVDAARSIRVGDPEDPGSFLGPVIDANAHQRILEYIAIGEKEGKLLLRSEAPKEGYFIGPTIIEISDPKARLVQEEIFGPVLGVLKAGDFEEALRMANDTEFALTGGVFSRSPENIARARKDFRVGNLYINRGCTGAMVGRHPFGGFKMSGVGSKAGGPDYLLQFMEPRSVHENTLRRGFAPED